MVVNEVALGEIRKDLTSLKYRTDLSLSRMQIEASIYHALATVQVAEAIAELSFNIKEIDGSLNNISAVIRDLETSINNWPQGEPLKG